MISIPTTSRAPKDFKVVVLCSGWRLIWGGIGEGPSASWHLPRYCIRWARELQAGLALRKTTTACAAPQASFRLRARVGRAMFGNNVPPALTEAHRHCPIFQAPCMSREDYTKSGPTSGPTLGLPGASAWHLIIEMFKNRPGPFGSEPRL